MARDSFDHHRRLCAVTGTVRSYRHLGLYSETDEQHGLKEDA